MQAMDALWSNRHPQCIPLPVAFVRPRSGDGKLAAYLANRAVPTVSFSYPVASLLGEFGLVTCHERVADNSLVYQYVPPSGREW